MPSFIKKFRLVIRSLRLKKPKEFTVGSQLNLKLTDRYIGAHLDVDIYQITNHSRQTVTITENELFQSGDRAIYLQENNFAPSTIDSND